MKLLVSGTTSSVRRWLPQSNGRLGVLLTPASGNAVESIIALGCSWAADNGCFNGLDEAAYRRMLDRIEGMPGLMWVTCPDVVAWSRFTEELFEEWEPELTARKLPIAYVVQDGQKVDRVPWSRIAAVFIGGTTRFKLGPGAKELVTEAKRRGKSVHMGRVNTIDRLELAASWGCESCDGSSMSMFGERYIPKFLGIAANADRQRLLTVKEH